MEFLGVTCGQTPHPDFPHGRLPVLSVAVILDLTKESLMFRERLYTTRGTVVITFARRSLCCKILKCFFNMAVTFGDLLLKVSTRLACRLVSAWGPLSPNKMSRSRARALLIASFMIFSGYFCFFRTSRSWLALESKSSLLEHTRLNLWAWLYGILVRQGRGWQLSKCKYLWLSVGFRYSWVTRVVSLIITLTSKKLMSVFE